MNPAIANWLTRPGGIVERLAAMRSRSGVRHREMAERLSWPPSKVSKLENGKQLPSADDLRGWATACGASEEADALVAMLDEVEGIRLEWKNRLAGGGNAEVQVDHAELAARASVIRNYEVAVVPGLLQLQGYTRAVLEDAYDVLGVKAVDLDGDVAARSWRQGVLYDTSKSFEFVIAEPALRWPAAGPEVMGVQFDRLITAMGMGAVHLSVLPLGRRPRIVPPLGFIIYGDTVVAEHVAGEVAYREGTPQYAAYVSALERLRRAAVEGDEARQLIIRAADDLRA